MLRDETGGRVTEAVRRQATVDDDEQRWVLIDQDQLDGYVNFAYRALKTTATDASSRRGSTRPSRCPGC